jgi:RNA polymerase sigma-70 factor (family 1)
MILNKYIFAPTSIVKVPMSSPSPEINLLITEQSFIWLFNDNWNKVYTIFYKGTGDRELAKELSQNIFKSIWERRATLHISGKPEYYLLGAAKLMLINHYRNAKIRAEHQLIFEVEYSDTDNCTEQQVLYKDLNNEVQSLVDRLPGQSKLVYQLSYEQHLSNKQVAAKLQVSLKTVEYHLSSARKLLRRSLQEFIS